MPRTNPDLRNEWPNIHKTGIDWQAIWQGFQICNSCSDWRMFGSINLSTFVMTMKLTLWITWFLDDLSWNLISHMLPKTYNKFRVVIFQALLWHVHVKGLTCTCQRSAWMIWKDAKYAFIVCIAGLHFKIYIVAKLKILPLWIFYMF